MIKLCENCNIAYASDECPLCEALEENQFLEFDIVILSKKLKVLEADLNSAYEQQDLNERIESSTKQWSKIKDKDAWLKELRGE